MSTCIETKNLILHNSLPLKWNANADIVPNDDSAKKGQCRDMNIYIYRNNNEYLNLLVYNSLPLTWTAEMVPDKKIFTLPKKGRTLPLTWTAEFVPYKKCDCQKKELQRNKHLHL